MIWHDARHDEPMHPILDHEALSVCLNVSGRAGMGVHSGRNGPQSKAMVCIRTDDESMEKLNPIHDETL